MKNISKTLFLSILVVSFHARAQQPDIYRNILIDEQAAAELEKAPADAESIAKAQEQARQLLNKRPQTLRKQSFPKLRQRAAKPVLPTAVNTNAAPFGLIWGASIADTKNQGIQMTKIDEKDYVNNFIVTHLPKGVSDFTKVAATFGEEDELWRIIAYGDLLDDSPDADKVMRVYKIYYDLLSKKYGHAQQFFTPAQISVEKKDAKGKMITVQENAPLGNSQFLSQLQSGQAELYATFYNDEVGAALAVNVDGDGKSYIVLDYKNLRILRSRENKALDAL